MTIYIFFLIHTHTAIKCYIIHAVGKALLIKQIHNPTRKMFHIIVEKLSEQTSILFLTHVANPTLCSFKVWGVYYKFLCFGIICGSCSHALGICTMRYFCQCKAATNLKVQRIYHKANLVLNSIVFF